MLDGFSQLGKSARKPAVGHQLYQHCLAGVSRHASNDGEFSWQASASHSHASSNRWLSCSLWLRPQDYVSKPESHAATMRLHEMPTVTHLLEQSCQNPKSPSNALDTVSRRSGAFTHEAAT